MADSNLDPHLPKTKPLESIDELLQWQPQDPFNIALVDLQERHPEGSSTSFSSSQGSLQNPPSFIF